MTTIVALKDRMLCDSMCSDGDTHFPCEKVYRIGKELIGTAGDVPSIEKFLRWYTGGRKKPLELSKGDNFTVLVLNKHGIFIYCNCSMPDKVLRDYQGVGSGWPLAHAAMLAGADAKRAIEITCEVSRSSGLPVQEFMLKEKS